MTKLLDQAIAVARALPEGRQDDIARLILETAHDERTIVILSAEEEASFDESIAQEERGEFVDHEKVKVFWAKA